MYVYILLIFCCTLNGLVLDKFYNRNSRNFKTLLFITFFLLFIVAALRFEVGRDYTETYVYSYVKIAAGVKNVRMDIALKGIYKIMAVLHANVQWIFVITSFLINYFACKSIATQSPNCKMSFLIYLCGTFYFFSMNGVRQSVAIMIFYYSFKYIEKHNFKKYAILNGIGFLFHSSAILFIPLYFILNKKYKFKMKMILIFATVLATKVIVPFLTSILLQTHYAMYLTNGAYSSQDSLNFSMYLNILILVLYEIVIWMKKSDNNQAIIYSNIHFCGVIVSLLATSLPMMIRIFMSFRYLEFLSVPYLIEIQPKRRYKQLIELAVILLYLVYFIHGVLIENGNTVLPYRTIFNKGW